MCIQLAMILYGCTYGWVRMSLIYISLIHLHFPKSAIYIITIAITWKLFPVGSSTSSSQENGPLERQSESPSSSAVIPETIRSSTHNSNSVLQQTHTDNASHVNISPSVPGKYFLYHVILNWVSRSSLLRSNFTGELLSFRIRNAKWILLYQCRQYRT